MPDSKLTDLGSLAAIVPANLLLYVVDTSEAVLANKSKKLAFTLLNTYNDSRYATFAQGATADTAVQPVDLALVAFTGAYADLSGTPTLATVATSGAYGDLSGLPTLGTLAALSSPLPILNGGTGATTDSGARTNLGLGTIATQAANNVTISGGSITGITDLAIADGGTGQSTAQAAIDALSGVAAATNEHVLTKDTATGNAIFKAAAGGGSSLPVADTQTIVMGSADNTKLLRFEVDGFTAGATRVLTPPNANATIAGLEVAQTFTRGQAIVGSASEVQLSVKNHSSQGSLPIVLFSSSGTILASFSNTGNLVIGNNGGMTGLVGYGIDKTGTAFGSFSAGADLVLIGYQSTKGFVFGRQTSISNSPTTPYSLFTDSNSRVEFGGSTVTAIPAQVRAIQASTTAAIPTLQLEQLDLSEELIEFTGTVATGNPIEAVGAKTLTTTHFIRMSVNGSFVYIPVGTIA